MMNQERIREIVHRLIREHGFRAGVLTDASGLPLVALPDGADAEAPAAMVALVKRVFDQVHHRVGLRAMDEMVLQDEVGQRLVCRRIALEQRELVLAVLVPPQREHRSATDWAVHQIKQAWSN